MMTTKQYILNRLKTLLYWLKSEVKTVAQIIKEGGNVGEWPSGQGEAISQKLWMEAGRTGKRLYDGSTPSSPVDQCIVKGCINQKNHGNFIGPICVVCFKMITKGNLYQPSNNFIYQFVKEVEKSREWIRTDEELPEPLETVLVMTIHGVNTVGFWNWVDRGHLGLGPGKMWSIAVLPDELGTKVEIEPPVYWMPYPLPKNNS